MVYYSEQIFIPNVYGWDGQAATLSVTDNVGLEVATQEISITPGPNYLTATLSLELTEGEYTYRITSGGRVYSEGLLIVGDYTPDRTEKETSIVYEQYGN